MKKNLFLLVAMICVTATYASTFHYNFHSTRLSDALTQLAEQHPDLHINFIYNELDNYKTSAAIRTKDAYEALRQIIGLNPVSVIKKGKYYYIEALQHGKYKYTGNVIGDDEEPLIGASVMLLTPRDSTVVTYGVTDLNGRFSIPCDKKNILAKFTCVGYKTVYINLPKFAMGTVRMKLSPIQLSTVSVEGYNTILSTDKNVYIPTPTQKNASQEAADLLRRMAIPQLVINPGDNSIKDVFGNSVPVYINYHEAQPEELKGMKMTDVRKIEYIEFPTDPRFKGEERVVNFIVQEYEYGGYSKASESFVTISGIFNSTNVFSRFTYKKMTYDIYAGSDNQDFHHAGTDNTAFFCLDDRGTPLTLTRKEVLKEAETRTNEYPLTARASYYSPHFTARNTLSFTHYSSPRQTSSGDLKVSVSPERGFTYSRSNPDRNNTVYYNGSFWGTIGSKASFDITPTFRHTHRNDVSSYEATLLNTMIFNQVAENTYNWGIQANARIGLGTKSQLSLFISGGQNINKLEYQGTNNAYDSYYNSYIGGFLRYRYQAKKISLSTYLGYTLDHHSMNQITTNGADPRAGVDFWLSISRKSQISGHLSFQSTTPDISMKANDIVQSNEYMYFTANPELENWRNLKTNLSYNYYRNNSFSLAAFTGYEHDFNRVATIYLPYKGGSALLRDYINEGSYIRYYVGMSANYKLLNNSLQLYANITQNAYEITGENKDSYYPFRIQLQAVYYWKSFNILAAWTNPQNRLTENSNYIIRGRNFQMLSIGWGNGSWTVNLSAKNIFNKGWRYETWEKQTPLYSEYKTVYSPSPHASLNLSVTYTIGYGKKVQRGNEVGGQGSAPSAIIR